MRGATQAVLASAAPANTQGAALQELWWRDDCRHCTVAL